MKKYKLNLEKLKNKIPIIIGAIIVLLAITIFPNTLSRYSDSAKSGTAVDVAFTLFGMENEIKTQNVALEKVAPGEKKDYRFSISNIGKDVNDNVSRINVKTKYFLIFKVTTNLDIKYNLLKNGSEMNPNFELEQDEDGTYFKTFRYPSSGYLEMGFDNDITDYYQLEYSFPSNYIDYENADVIELLSIELHTEQYSKD